MFEWDEAKRLRNLADKRVDFVDVLDVFDSADRLEFPDTRRAYGETRYNILCPLHGRLFQRHLDGEGQNPPHHLRPQSQQTGGAQV